VVCLADFLVQKGGSQRITKDEEIEENDISEARGGMMEEEKQAPRRLSRREFVKGAAVGTAGAAAGALAGCAPAATPAPTEAPPTPTPIIKEIIKEVPVELQEAIGHIVHDPEVCAGCRTCMAICSLSHSGAVSPELSGIQVLMFPSEGGVVHSNVCQHCKGPECLYACQVGALYIDEATGARVIDADKCIGCRLCQQACPNKKSDPYYYGDGLAPIRYDAENNVCFKCDLCGGDPQCVKFCPMNALSIQEEEV